MKKYFLACTFILLTGSTIFFACKKNNDNDTRKQLDAKVLATVNQNITRAELAALSLQEQMTTFEELTSANKKRIYEEKVDLIINTENLSQAEIDHLNSAVSLVTESMYEGEFTGEPQSVIDWIAYASNTLSWSDETIHWYVETWSTPEEWANRPIDMGGGGSPTENNCVCRRDIWCLWGYGVQKDDCESGCKKTRTNCGFFGTMPCTGDCQ